MYFDTVDGATSKPSINSSPWIREAPQSEFSVLMRRINSRSSRSILGRPTLFRHPPPEASKSSTMPTKNCLGLSDLDDAEPAGPQSNHPDQQCSVTAQQSDARRLLP